MHAKTEYFDYIILIKGSWADYTHPYSYHAVFWFWLSWRSVGGTGPPDPNVGEDPPLALLRVSSEVLLLLPFRGFGGSRGGSSPWTPARLSLRAGMAGGGLKYKRKKKTI